MDQHIIDQTLAYGAIRDDCQAPLDEIHVQSPLVVQQARRIAMKAADEGVALPREHFIELRFFAGGGFQLALKLDRSCGTAALKKPE